MSTSLVRVAPERHIRPYLADPPVEGLDACQESAPNETQPAVQADEVAEPVGSFPFLLIATGIIVYFVAIAMFASFAGVAFGVTVIVLGGSIYVCRGLSQEPESAADVPLEHPSEHYAAFEFGETEPAERTDIPVTVGIDSAREPVAV